MGCSQSSRVGSDIHPVGTLYLKQEFGDGHYIFARITNDSTPISPAPQGGAKSKRTVTNTDYRIPFPPPGAPADAVLRVPLRASSKNSYATIPLRTIIDNQRPRVEFTIVLRQCGFESYFNWIMHGVFPDENEDVPLSSLHFEGEPLWQGPHSPDEQTQRVRNVFAVKGELELVDNFEDWLQKLETTATLVVRGKEIESAITGSVWYLPSEVSTCARANPAGSHWPCSPLLLQLSVNVAPKSMQRAWDEVLYGKSTRTLNNA